MEYIIGFSHALTVHVHETSNLLPIGVWEYIESTRDKVRDLERRVRLAKANVEQMHNIMTGWSQSPLFRRKEDKKDTLLNLEVQVAVAANTLKCYMKVTNSLNGTP